MPSNGILKATPEVADSKDGKARDKAKELIVRAAAGPCCKPEQDRDACASRTCPACPAQVELSRWMGPDMIRNVVFKSLRDALKEGIEGGMAGRTPMHSPPADGTHHHPAEHHLIAGAPEARQASA